MFDADKRKDFSKPLDNLYEGVECRSLLGVILSLNVSIDEFLSIGLLYDGCVKVIIGERRPALLKDLLCILRCINLRRQDGPSVVSFPVIAVLFAEALGPLNDNGITFLVGCASSDFMLCSTTDCRRDAVE